MTTALQLMQKVYRYAGETDLTSFSTSQSRPHDIALQCLNYAIDELNLIGRYTFMEQSTALTYTSGVYQYSFNTLGIQREGIKWIERQLSGYQGILDSININEFRTKYRYGDIGTSQPTVWSDYGDTLELNNIPDQDYSLVIYHIPMLAHYTATTDVIEVPTKYEHVIEMMAYASLWEALQHPDRVLVKQRAKENAKNMLTDPKRYFSRARVMPGAF